MKENMKSFNTKNIVLISQNIKKNEKRYKSRELPRRQCHSALETRASPRTLPDALIFEPFRTLNDEMQIFELTSRRGDVATLLNC